MRCGAGICMLGEGMLVLWCYWWGKRSNHQNRLYEHAMILMMPYYPCRCHDAVVPLATRI